MIVAPYVTAWSAEPDLQCNLVADRDGLRYATELPGDRDGRGVLWARVADHLNEGRPEFARVHPARQRRAMGELLCQVCAGPADRNPEGVLWLMRDHRDEGPRWPEDMASTEPPVCARCVPVAVRRCPALQRGAVAVRVREFGVVGVWGTLYRPGAFAPRPLRGAHVAYGDPKARWVVATALVRLLRGCRIVDLPTGGSPDQR